MTSLIECSLNDISHAIDKCKFAQKYCNDEEMVKFTQFFYCELQESYPILIILSIVLILATFHLLSSTAEIYLSPSLAKISDFFKLSQNLAGVTLLALGNGAPDVFTAIIAGAGGTEDSEGIHLAICSIFGSGIFVTTVTLAKVIINAEEIKADKKTFTRDICFYTLATFLILLYTVIGRVNFIMAMLFFSLYFVYLAVVLYQEWESKRNSYLEIQAQLLGENGNEIQMQNNQQNLDDSLETADIQSYDNGLNFTSKSSSLTSYMKKSYLQPEDQEEVLRNKTQNNYINSGLFCDLKESQSLLEDFFKGDDEKILGEGIKKIFYNSSLTDVSLKTTVMKTKQHSMQFRISHNFLRMKSSLKNRMLNFDLQWKDMLLWQKCLFIYEFPINFVRDITIPSSEKDTWNKWLAIFLCYSSPLFFLFYTDYLDQHLFSVPVLGITLVLSSILAFCVWKFSYASKPPSFSWIFSIMGFINSIIWIAFAAQILVDFLGLIQLVTNINKTYLGLTLLAFGNSAGGIKDFFTNPQLAKMGYGVMAMTGCFAGQLFNTLLGFGLALIIKTKSSDIEFSVFNGDSGSEIAENLIILNVLLFSLINLIIFMLIAKKSKKSSSTYLNAIYCLFFFSSTLLMILSVNLK